jgi:arginine-tRNA-protein transferase
MARFRTMLAAGVTADELDGLFAAGWRKFGVCFFRPACPACRQCIPLRIPVAAFRPGKSQRRTRRRCAKVVCDWGGLMYRDELFSLYARHASRRFGAEASFDQFWHSFYEVHSPALQTEYRIDGKLAGAGFLDCSTRALSSVYFMFEPVFSRYRLGIYSIIREIDLAARLGREFYYLGYWIAGNSHMAYKAEFFDHERLDWTSGRWRRAERPVRTSR